MSAPAFSAQQLIDDSIMLRVDHIPAIARMCHRLGLTDLINDSIPCNTEVDIGTLVTGMVCDTLSGRNPLYKVEEFIAEQDTELLKEVRAHLRLEADLLQSYCQVEARRYPKSKASQRLVPVHTTGHETPR